ETYLPTIEVDAQRKELDFTTKDGNSIHVALQLLDISGSDKFAPMTTSYFKRAHGMVIVYDVTNEQSFEHADLWLRECLRFSSTKFQQHIAVFANKTDLTQERTVTGEAGTEFAQENKITLHEVSAKNGQGIEEGFESVI